MNVSRDLILKTATEIAHEILAPNSEMIDREAHWPEQGIRALQNANLGGLVVPREYGGLGYGLLLLAEVCEILGRECTSTALCYGMHCVASAVIAAKATPYQQENYLAPISEGKHLTTLSLSEPGTGTHFYLPQTKLEKTSSNMFTVTGTKVFVTNGSHADSYVISTVATDPNAPMDQFSCLIVPKETNGLKWGKHWEGLGMRGNSSRNLELNKIKVPQENLLGDEGDQLWYVFQVVGPYFLMAMAGTYLGVASTALEEAKSHLMRRRHTHNSTTLAQLPLLQHRIGVLWGVVERTRQLVYYAGREADSEGPNALLALLAAKAEVGDCAVNVTNEVMTLMGGIAYGQNTKLHRLLRDARAAHVMSPTTDILRTWTGRAILDQPILGG